MKQLAAEGMTMLVVSHEMAFAREVADWLVYMDEGQIVEIGHPKQVFESPRNERTKTFLSRVREPHNPRRRTRKSLLPLAGTGVNRELTTETG
jgi:ABC-type glutathione transport system ATPase component